MGVNILSKCQLPSSYGLGLKIEDSEEKSEVENQLMNDNGVCRTAPATTGLFIIQLKLYQLNEGSWDLVNFSIKLFFT